VGVQYRKENTETVMPLLELTTISSESDEEEDVEKGTPRRHRHKERVFLSSVKEAPSRKHSGH
jgi:hypothetical protein